MDRDDRWIFTTTPDHYSDGHAPRRSTKTVDWDAMKQNEGFLSKPNPKKDNKPKSVSWSSMDVQNHEEQEPPPVPVVPRHLVKSVDQPTEPGCLKPMLTRGGEWCQTYVPTTQPAPDMVRWNARYLFLQFCFVEASMAKCLIG